MKFSEIDFAKIPLYEIYGSNCFNESEMRSRLPKSIYKEVKRVQTGEAELSLEVAEVVASAMKDWAIDKGATHYTHWFQPLTGLTAEKHDSFISPTPDGKVIMEFSGKELIQGEPDASSFPSGGLRATFEARGYTAWDVASPAFVREDSSGVTLCIPTAFVSYTGHALDKKVPLLRSMEAVNTQALRVLKTLGREVRRVVPTIGPEQEYFLVDKRFFDKRPDLLLAGRTVIGSMPAKGQELEDHYFGSIKERAALFMKELNYELWKLGISAKTQHNEVAPNQFEIASIFDTANVAADRNQLVMDALQRVARRHDLVALLHEKPFAGVNGSGKHNNWSLATDTGDNLLEPGESPHDNAQFLLFLVAVIKAVDKYAALLRTSAAKAGNDHRLGANEAPPAIISIFLGDQLTAILDKIGNGGTMHESAADFLEIGVSSLPRLPKDLTDRNRTSPFAFTGNKFEFRMVASSQSVSSPNYVLNTAVAEVLAGFADELEASSNTQETLNRLVKETYKNHKRIIFNGNGYADDWIKEAEKRGLPNIPSTVEALKEWVSPESVALFENHNIFTRQELESRYHIYLESYSRQINIEANILREMAENAVLPAGAAHVRELGDTIASVAAALPQASAAPLKKEMKTVLREVNELIAGIDALKTALEEAKREGAEPSAAAELYHSRVIAAMDRLRSAADLLEMKVPRQKWPFPTYEDLLFRL